MAKTEGVTVWVVVVIIEIIHKQRTELMSKGQSTTSGTKTRLHGKASGATKLRRLGKVAVWVIPGIVVPLLIYQLTRAEPDIRYVCDSSRVLEPLDKKYDPATGTTQLYFRIFETFKNNSTKSGRIDKVEFTPLEINVRPTIEVTHIDKEDLGWGEQRRIEVRFNITLTREMSNAMALDNKQMAVTMKAYDNTGKSLKLCNSDTPYSTTFNLSAQR